MDCFATIFPQGPQKPHGQRLISKVVNSILDRPCRIAIDGGHDKISVQLRAHYSCSAESLMLRKIRETGLVYTLAILYGRIVPAWMLRVGLYDVFHMSQCSVQGSVQNEEFHSHRSDMQVAWADDEANRKSAKQLSQMRDCRLEDSKRACVASTDEKLVGVTWISNDSYCETDAGLRFDLAENQTWLFASYVDAAHRRTGIYRRLIAFLVAEDPQSELLFSVQRWNKRSQRAHRALGAEQLGSFLSVRLFGAAFCFVFSTSCGVLSIDRCLSMYPSNSPIQVRIAIQD